MRFGYQNITFTKADNSRRPIQHLKKTTCRQNEHISRIWLWTVKQTALKPMFFFFFNLFIYLFFILWCIPCFHNYIDSKHFNFYSHRHKPLIVCICCWDFVTKTSCLYVALLLSQMFCCRSARFFYKGIRIDRHKSDGTLSHIMLIFPAFQRGLGFLLECIILRLFFLKKNHKSVFFFG